MRILSFDWGTKKELAVYDSKIDKVKKIANSIEVFEKFLEGLNGEKAITLFEFGGGDVFKIMAFRAGHSIFQVPGKKIKDYRESLGIKKTDEGDAKLIYDFWNLNGGESATLRVSNSSDRLRLSADENKGRSASPGVDESLAMKPPSFLKNNEGERAKHEVSNSRDVLPLSFEKKEGDITTEVGINLGSPMSAFFYPFSESNASLAELKILFREHEDLKKEMVREKLKKIAFERRFKLAQVDDDRIKKILFHKAASIVAKEKEVEQIKKILEKKVGQFPVWDNYLKGIKGVGPVIAVGLIGELGDKHFDSDESLKHYAGMVAKRDHGDYNRFLKSVLFQFAEQIIKKRTDPWRSLYDDMKIYYQKKHEDWSKGKVNAYTKKFIETKFLLEFWKKIKEEGRSYSSYEAKIYAGSALPSPLIK
jgi:hypothetical protein